MKIESGVLDLKVILALYGVEGIGKSTFASKAPNPLFIDTEGSTSRLNVRRIRAKAWEEVLAAVNYVRDNPSVCQTLVIDTLDWAEIECIQYVCAKNRVASIEAIPFGKGYTYVADEFNVLLKALTALRDQGIHIIVIAHAKPRKFELPEEIGGQYDRYEMKLSRQVSPLIKEWCDMLLFANYKTYVVTTENNTKKATGGKRTLFTTHSPCWDAKNRFGLKDELDLDFKEIAHLFKTEKVEEKKVKEEPQPERATITKIKELLTASNITEAELKNLVASKGHYAAEVAIEDYSDEFITRWIIPNWKKIVETINKNKEGK